MREHDICETDLTEAKEEIARLRSALEKYGRHTDGLCILAGCTCGLSTALQGGSDHAKD